MSEDSLLELLWEIFSYLGKRAMWLLIIIVIASQFIGCGSPLVYIAQGEAGVGYSVWTGEETGIYDSGMSWILPTTMVFKYPTTVQTEMNQENFTTSDGGKITVIQYVSYRLDPRALDKIKPAYGEEYFAKLVRPCWMDDTKQLVASEPLGYFLDPDRDVREVGGELTQEMNADLNDEGITDVIIRIQEISLPEGVNTAINMKQELDASDNDTEFVADYKRAEAIGRNGNQVVVTGM